MKQIITRGLAKKYQLSYNTKVAGGRHKREKGIFKPSYFYVINENNKIPNLQIDADELELTGDLAITLQLNERYELHIKRYVFLSYPALLYDAEDILYPWKVKGQVKRKNNDDEGKFQFLNDSNNYICIYLTS